MTGTPGGRAPLRLAPLRLATWRRAARRAPARLLATTLAAALATAPLPRVARAQGTPELAPGPDTTAVDAPSPAASAPLPRPDVGVFDPTPIDRETREEMDRVLDAIGGYEAQTEDFRTEVQTLIESKYEEKRQRLRASFEGAIQDLERGERERRQEAIDRFEAFVERYPNDPTYTAHALYRLGELQFEKSKDDFMQAQRDYTERLEQFDQGKLRVEPTAPEQNFSRTIAIEQRLINDFPSYQHVDGAHYILGYCLAEQGEGDEARRVFLSLVQKYPRSLFVPEVYMRLGEYHFDQVGAGELAKAAEMYTKAIEAMRALDPNHPLYDKTLYKLAWTYYRMDRFGDAVRMFTELLDFYQAKVGPDGELEGEMVGESLEYLAISYSEEGWSEHGVDKLLAYFDGLGGRPYAMDAMRKLGDVYFEKTTFGEAVRAYKLVLERDPLAPDAAKLQSKLILAYERDRDFASASAERDKLALNYGPGSEWWKANESRPDVLRDAEERTQAALYQSAIFHHQQAQAFREKGNTAMATREYDAAAIAYGQFLERYPNAVNAYELRFYWAEALYWSQKFELAAQQYGRVRDTLGETKYLYDAALGAVLAYQNVVKEREASGELEVRKPLVSRDLPEGAAVPPLEEIPPLRAAFVKAIDSFVAKLPRHEQAPVLLYNAAETYYKYFDFDEARRRFDALLKAYPSHEVAQFAANLIIESYLLAKDWVAVASRAQAFIVGKVGSEEFRGSLVSIRYKSLFKEAQRLDEAGKLEQAAVAYIKLVQEDPKNEVACMAMYSAARAYFRDSRFESAARTYERVVNEYPGCEWAATSLFFLADSNDKAYEFETAVKYYMRLFEQYPKFEKRVDALYNSCFILENIQNYDAAAKMCRKYADTFPDKEDAPDLFYKSCLVWDKADRTDELIRCFGEFTKRYGGRPRYSEKVVEAQYRIAKAFDERAGAAKQRSARQDFQKRAGQYWSATLGEYQRRGLKPGTQAAEYAAEARFRQAEQKFEEYDAIRFGGKKLVDSLKKKAELRQAVINAYKEVFGFKRIAWTLAALYRIGYADERFAFALFDAPCPAGLNDDECQEYRVQLEDKAFPIEDRAKAAYEKTLEQSRQAKVVNEWTEATLKSLNRMDPKKYPLEKKPLYPLAVDDFTPVGFELLAAGDAEPSEELLPIPPPPPPAAAEPEPQGAPQPEPEPEGEPVPVIVGRPAPVPTCEQDADCGPAGVCVDGPNGEAPRCQPKPCASAAECPAGFQCLGAPGATVGICLPVEGAPAPGGTP